MKLAPSILAADLADLAAVLKGLEAANCDYVHFDIMDGHFVPNLTFGPPLVRRARKHSGLPFDVHLMVTDPAVYVEQLAGQNVRFLSFQIETTSFGPRLVELIREYEMGPSVALNPQTSLSAIEELLPVVENVLIMSVDPGFAGQKFIPQVMTKIEKLAAYRDEMDLMYSIQVDGGVNDGNLDLLAEAGVDIVVAGNAYFKAADPAEFARRVQAAPRLS